MTVINSTNLNFITTTSVASTFTSAMQSVSNFLGYTIQITVAGGSSPTGVFKLQQSNDGTIWNDFATAITQSITTNGSFTLGDSNVYYNFVRVVYTRTSGTGNATASFVGKG